jgi:hypothetical protein
MLWSGLILAFFSTVGQLVFYFCGYEMSFLLAILSPFIGVMTLALPFVALAMISSSIAVVSMTVISGLKGD